MLAGQTVHTYRLPKLLEFITQKCYLAVRSVRQGLTFALVHVISIKCSPSERVPAAEAHSGWSAPQTL